jgi:hypothetical protein
VDPDFFSDYSPYPSLRDLRLPAGYAFVYTKGIPAAQMPVLLQRAKIVLDLGTLSIASCHASESKLIMRATLRSRCYERPRSTIHLCRWVH